MAENLSTKSIALSTILTAKADLFSEQKTVVGLTISFLFVFNGTFKNIVC